MLPEPLCSELHVQAANAEAHVRVSALSFRRWRGCFSSSSGRVGSSLLLDPIHVVAAYVLLLVHLPHEPANQQCLGEHQQFTSHKAKNGHKQGTASHEGRTCWLGTNNRLISLRQPEQTPQLAREAVVKRIYTRVLINGFRSRVVPPTSLFHIQQPRQQ